MVLLHAHLQFHTQLQRKCKLSHNISSRNASQATWNTCPHYLVSVPISLLHPFLCLCQCHPHVFPGRQRLLAAFTNPPPPPLKCGPDCWAQWESSSNPRGRIHQQKEFISRNFTYSFCHHRPPSLHSLLRVKSHHGEPEPHLAVLCYGYPVMRQEKSTSRRHRLSAGWQRETGSSCAWV